MLVLSPSPSRYQCRCIASPCLLLVFSFATASFLLPVFAHTSHFKDHGAEYLKNLLNERSVGEAECDSLAEAVAENDKRTSAELKPFLSGTYVSQQCETRAGPEYVLQAWTFFESQSVRVIIFYYNDADCTSPRLAVSLKASWHASSASFIPTRLLLHPYTTSEAGNLERTVGAHCLKSSRRKRKELLVNGDVLRGGQCKQAVKLYIPDLTSLLTQTRRDQGRRVRELLVKDADHVRRYATPLIHNDLRHDWCPVCHAVAGGSLHRPPSLEPSPRLPPYLAGEWLSQRCELLPSGNFFTRRMTFSVSDMRWALETALYADFACATRVATVYTAGFYYLSDEGAVSGAYGLDLTERCSCFELSPNRSRIHDFHEKCRHHHHRVDGDGCRPVTHVSLTIFKLLMDRQGSPQLFLGQVGSTSARATAFQPPLIQCTINPTET